MLRIVVTRVVTSLLGVAMIGCAVAVSVGPARDNVAFHAARLCPGGVPTPASASKGCVARESGVVTGRHIKTETTSDESGVSTTIVHYVTYRRASGATETRQVGTDLYGAAVTGRPAELQIWNGAVVWITVAGQGDGFDPPTLGVLGYTAFAAWIGSGLLLWVLIGNGTLRQLFGNATMRPFGWIIFGMVTIYVAHDIYTDVMGVRDWVVDALIWVFNLAFGVFGVFYDVGDDESRGAESLARVAQERWSRRVDVRRRQKLADRPPRGPRSGMRSGG